MSALPRLTWLSFACGLMSACTLINPPSERRPQQNPCDAGRCRSEAVCADCDPLASCEPGDDGVRCTCPEDHRDVNGDGSACEPPAACAALRCGPNQRCSVDAGVATCRCRTGYEPADAGCVDVDECDRELHDCDPLARCFNRAGGFDCECPAGFDDRHGDGRRCTDIDECSGSEPVCGEHATCENRSGSFECHCEAGYAGNPRAGCEDTDECANGLLACRLPALCRSAPGPDACACPAYYSDVNGDGSVCRDDRIFARVTLAGINGLALAARPMSEPPGPVLVAAGGFEGTLGDVCGRSFTTSGQRDLFVASYDADLRCQFARTFGSPGHDDLRGMQVAPDGGALLLVELHGAFERDGVTIGIDGSSCALIQLDADMHVRWSFELPGCRNRAPETRAWMPAPSDRIGLDRDGNVYVIWAFPPGSAFGAIALPESQRAGVLLGKLSNEGTPLWVKAVLPEPDDPNQDPYGIAVSVDHAGNAYFLVNAYGRIQLPGSAPREGPSSVVLALAPGDGATRWVKVFPNEPQAVHDLVAHEDGVSLLRAESTTSGRRSFWQRLDPDGSERLHVDLGEGEIAAWALETDPAGHLGVIGQVYEPGSVLGEAATAEHNFLAKFDREGIASWTHLYDQALLMLEDLAIAPSGAMYVYGWSPAAGHQLFALRP